MLLLAAAVAGAVLLWPASPRWRVAAGPGQVLGVTPDGATVLRAARGAGGGIEIVGHATADGRERSRVTLVDVPAGLEPWWSVTLSPDARRLIVHQSDLTANGWALFDADRGTRLTPYVPQTRRFLAPVFSADGRWFDASAGNVLPDDEPRGSLDPRAAATGDPLPGFAAAPSETARGLAFDDRGDFAAVVWGRPTPRRAEPPVTSR